MSGPSFLVIGVGGLGCPLALALARAGAGRLVLVDDDVVDLSNLQRQVLFGTGDVGQAKVAVAREALRRRFPDVQVEGVRARFDEGSARALVHDADVVCDGSDNLATKFLVNDACAGVGRPFVIAGVVRYTGQVFPVRPGVDGCYRCLFEDIPQEELATCADAGVLGAMCGVVAAWQARAAWALAEGREAGALIFEEGLSPRRIKINRRPGCRACGQAMEASA